MKSVSRSAAENIIVQALQSIIEELGPSHRVSWIAAGRGVTVGCDAVGGPIEDGGRETARGHEWHKRRGPWMAPGHLAERARGACQLPPAPGKRFSEARAVGAGELGQR